MLVVFDIDGVVVCNGKMISQMQEVLKELNRKKIPYTFATGRSYLRCVESVGDILPTIPLILENGSKILQADGSMLKNFPLEYNSLEYIKTLLHSNCENIDYACFSSYDNLKYFFYAPSITRFNMNIKFCLTLTKCVDKFVDAAVANKCTQITICTKKREEIIVDDDRIEKSENNFLHIKEKGINKGMAVEVLSKYLSIPLNSVIVVGNDYNDIEMFRLNVREKILIVNNAVPNIDLIKYNVMKFNHNELVSYVYDL